MELPPVESVELCLDVYRPVAALARLRRSLRLSRRRGAITVRLSARIGGRNRVRNRLRLKQWPDHLRLDQPRMLQDTTLRSLDVLVEVDRVKVELRCVA